MKSETSAPGGQSATQDSPVFPGTDEGTSFWDHLSRTASLALPVMLSRAGMVLMLTVDTAIVGHLAFADRGLAAFGAALIPLAVLQTAAIGLLIGVIVRSAQFDGAGKPEACGEVWRLGLILALILGVVYAAIMTNGQAILGLLGQPAEVAEGGGPVLRAMGWGMPEILVFIACAHFLEGISRPVAPMVLMLVGNIANAVLAYVLGTGAFGLPEGGAVGVATATALVRWGLGIGAVLLVLLTVDRRRYGITLRHTEGWDGFIALLRLGLPLAAAIGLETACFAMITNMSGWLGQVSLATMHAAINYTSFVYMLTIGLATAAAVRVGNAVGRGDWRGAQYAGWVAVILACALMAAVGTLTAIFPDQAASLLTDSPAVLRTPGAGAGGSGQPAGGGGQPAGRPDGGPARLRRHPHPHHHLRRQLLDHRGAGRLLVGLPRRNRTPCPDLGAAGGPDGGDRSPGIAVPASNRPPGGVET